MLDITNTRHNKIYDIITSGKAVISSMHKTKTIIRYESFHLWKGIYHLYHYPRVLICTTFFVLEKQILQFDIIGDLSKVSPYATGLFPISRGNSKNSITLPHSCEFRIQIVLKSAFLKITFWLTNITLCFTFYWKEISVAWGKSSQNGVIFGILSSDFFGVLHDSLDVILC